MNQFENSAFSNGQPKDAGVQVALAEVHQRQRHQFRSHMLHQHLKTWLIQLYISATRLPESISVSRTHINERLIVGNVLSYEQFVIRHADL